ncbi:hydroxymethylpterin pyrophosphokinase-dihydropteroate synthetase, putative [Plasmodium ovale curtisi]|uniref:2-amino-4-hydroxy-6-hydroxymethyldihydropteridine diphosphokinase n=1 Tax=Plasmodium ovale curtisi TaxID=864141 RepID=A0A1A8WYY9_PLAOA|nr:hydroxymethylpterin pyrophosphokinase-dihydropteroate synthetase, putative [Plasmodium ovale curtisi]
MAVIEGSINSEERTKRNIAVLNFGTNDKTNCVSILETGLYLTEKYIGKIINSSYLYETQPEYIILEKTNLDRRVTEEEFHSNIHEINEVITKLEKCKYEEEDKLIYKCEEYVNFINNEKINDKKIKEINVDIYKMETRKIIKENDKIMKINLEKYKNKYYTNYFFNLIVIVKTFIDNPLNMLVIIKYIEQLMKRKKKKKNLHKFQNRIIDIDILFFNNFTILEKNINLNYDDIYNIITQFIFIKKDDNNSSSSSSSSSIRSRGSISSSGSISRSGSISNNNNNEKKKRKKKNKMIERVKDSINFLCIPHVYTKYRYSILLCLNDILPNYKHVALGETINTLFTNYEYTFKYTHNINLKECNKRLYVLRDKIYYLKKKTHIVGILNVNYDSFSDGGLFVNPTIAVKRMFEMVNQGATVIDIGGESSAPYVVPNPSISERDLVLPVLKLFQEEWNKKEKNKVGETISGEGVATGEKMHYTTTKPIISIDTVNYDLFKECVEQNLVDILNDISACTNNPEIVRLLKRKTKYYSVVLMHKRGNPHTMDKLTQYNDLIYDIKNYLEERLNFLVLNGIPRYRILFDVGLGFAKKHDQSLKLLQHIHVYDDYPLFIGYSRKRFISHCMDQNCLTNTGAATNTGTNTGAATNTGTNKDAARNTGTNKDADADTDIMDDNPCNSSHDKKGKWLFQLNHMRGDKDRLLFHKNICGGLAIASYSFYKKVDLIRVHDVLETKAVLDVLAKIHQC